MVETLECGVFIVNGRTSGTVGTVGQGEDQTLPILQSLCRVRKNLREIPYEKNLKTSSQIQTPSIGGSSVRVERSTN